MIRGAGEKRLIRSGVLTAALLAATAVASCTDNLPTTAGGSLFKPDTPAGSNNLIALNCVASRVSLTVACDGPAGTSSQATGANGKKFNIVFGGQHKYVNLVSKNAAYASGVFSFDVTVQDTIPQPLGTTDGTTPDPAGVRVFFASGPTATSGSGTISVANASGVASYTGVNQPYFQYSGAKLGADGILTTNEVSDTLNWQLNMPATVNTFTFTLYVSAEVPNPNGYIDVFGASNVLAGNTVAPRAVVRSALGDSLSAVVTWSSSDAATATVDSASGVITGVSPGYANITAHSGTLLGSLNLGVCANLAVGGVATYTMPNAAKACFGGGGADEEFTYMPINQATSGSLSFSVTASGIQAVTGPPSPDLHVSNTILATSGAFAPKGPALEIGSDLPILEQDAAHYNALLQKRSRSFAIANSQARYNLNSRGGMTPRSIVTPNTVPSVGDLMDLNTNSACSGSPSVRHGQVRSVSQHLIVVSDTANPAGGFTTAQYDSIALEFDTLAWPVDTANFGAPTDLDNNGHVVAFFSRAVNELSPPASSSVVLGFFASKDVFGTDDCSNSNGQATVGTEIFYMLAPDPTGAVNSNVRTVSFVRGNTTGTLGHEFQHMINATRRAYVTGANFFETGFLNEGLSHIAEELMFYQASGMTTGATLVRERTQSQGFSSTRSE